jgi:quercetin dioxygenase-like cupin family protein
MHEHVAEGPITIHALEGNIIVRAEGDARTLAPGGLMAVDGGIRHDVSSDEGGLFLLTLVGPGPSHASEASLGSGPNTIL